VPGIVVRASLGSLAKLGLASVKQVYEPSTLYLLQYSPVGCIALCAFCAQSRVFTGDKKFLGRVTWYPIELGTVIEKLAESGSGFERICFQTVLKPGFAKEALSVVEQIRSAGVKTPISVAINPVHESFLESLGDLGVDYVGVGLDAASPRVFALASKPYSWKAYTRFIEKAVEVFGWRRVYTHLIVGLGEKPRELYETMEELIESGSDVALFPYTRPGEGFKPAVSLEYHRVAQIIRYFLLKGYTLREIARGDKLEEWVYKQVASSIDEYKYAFYTSGCPGCNRPYYTEKPRGPFYNVYSDAHYYSYKSILEREIAVLGESSWVAR